MRSPIHPLVRRTSPARPGLLSALTLLPLAFLLVAGGCNRDRGSSTASKRIGVTLLTREHEFYRELEAGLRDAAKKKGYELLVTSGDLDLAKQQSQIENFIVQGVDAIIVCPVDSKGIGPAIQKANAAKIPVFTADISAQGGDVVSHIASDNVAGGRLAAKYLIDVLHGNGRVGIIGQPEVQSTIDREEGFKEELATAPHMTLVASLNGGGVRDRALKAADDMLQAHPEMEGIFAINDESALGVLSAAQTRGDKNLVIVGYDATPEAVRAIKGGTELRADVAQQPRAIGEMTIDAIAKYFAKTPVPKLVTVPVKLVTADTTAADSAGVAKGS